MSADSRMIELLIAARSVQWSPGLLKNIESEGRMLGVHSDPTTMIALDDRRLAVREAVKKVERHLGNPRSTADRGALVEELETALDRWSQRL